jgi:hypothetical protein
MLDDRSQVSPRPSPPGGRGRRARLPALLAAALALAVPPPAALRSTAARGATRTAPAPSTAGADFRFTCLDHAYSQPVVAAPIEAGKLSVQLASPRNKLVLRSHRLRLAPTYADGSYAAELTVEFFGKGRLSADVDLAGYGHRFEEELLVPPQTRVLGGRVRVERAGGGYRITPLSLPRTMTVAIRSRLGDDVVGLCERLAAVPFSSLDCGGLDRALSTAVVPLPAPGESFWIAPQEVTAAERREVDRYLAATGAPARPGRVGRR